MHCKIISCQSYLEIIELMLNEYMFEINDKILRKEAKQRTEYVLKKLSLDWFKVICNGSNNTRKSIIKGDLIVGFDIRFKTGEKIKFFDIRVGKDED